MARLGSHFKELALPVGKEETGARAEVRRAGGRPLRQCRGRGGAGGLLPTPTAGHLRAAAAWGAEAPGAVNAVIGPKRTVRRTSGST